MTQEGFFQPTSIFNIDQVREISDLHPPTVEQVARCTVLVNHQPDADRLRDILGL